MIHYTLLPREETKSLRIEYRLRLFISACLFISCAVILGIVSLLPSYMLSRSRQADVVARTAEMEKNLKASGADEIGKDLAASQAIAQKIISDESGIDYAATIAAIISHKPAGITLDSFAITSFQSTTTPYTMVIQGNAATRDELLAFKQGLEEDSSFSQIDLPLSDLAKSSKIDFAIKFFLQNK